MSSWPVHLLSSKDERLVIQMRTMFSLIIATTKGIFVMPYLANDITNHSNLHFDLTFYECENSNEILDTQEPCFNVLLVQTSYTLENRERRFSLQRLSDNLLRYCKKTKVKCYIATCHGSLVVMSFVTFQSFLGDKVSKWKRWQ